MVDVCGWGASREQPVTGLPVGHPCPLTASSTGWGAHLCLNVVSKVGVPVAMTQPHSNTPHPPSGAVISSLHSSTFANRP